MFGNNSWLSKISNIFSNSTKLIDENGNSLSELDILRKNLFLSKGYLSFLENKNKEIHENFQNDTSELDNLSKGNESVKKLHEDQKKRLEDFLLQDLYDNRKSIESASEDIKKALNSLVQALSNPNPDFAYKKYLKSSLGRARKTMPQIDSSKIDDVILHFSGKSPEAKVTKETISCDKLIFIQGEINEDKVLDMVMNSSNTADRLLVSKHEGKYYLIDGAHRVSAMCELSENPEIDAYVIHLAPKEAVRRLNLMKVSRNDDISKAIEYSESIENMKKDRDPENIEKDNYAASIVIGGDGKILFLRRNPNDDFEPNTLCLPSGGIEDGELPINAAIRELYEETCLVASHVHPAKRIINDTSDISYYYVEVDRGEIVLDEEHSNYEWHSFDDLIKDEKTRSELILDLFDHLKEIFEPVQTKEMKIIRKAFNSDLISHDDYLESKDFFDSLEVIEKAEYKGRKVELNKPMKGDVKKYKVYVKNSKGNIIKVEFGDPNMEIKRDDPERRSSFRARHNCSDKKDKTTAGYWSCKMWSAKKVSDILKKSQSALNKNDSSKDDKISYVMKEFAEGRLKSSDGKIVTDKDQALAIAYSEADKLKKTDDDPCQDGYEQYGMKKKNGKEVPNCIPEK